MPNVLDAERGSIWLGSAKIFMTTIEPNVLDAVFPGLANVIMRLQGLDIKSPVITHSDTQIN
jgi:hypothetical protein